MKKNISINLFGTLYNIDEDACKLLEQYLDSMKRYFRSQEGGEEIADDIEHRVAELLWEQRQAGHEAVCIEDIRNIIAKIGNPQDIADDTSGPSESNYDKAENANDNYDKGEQKSTKERLRQMAEDAGDAAEEVFDKAKKHVRGRHLFRNPHDKVLGGVCSGIAAYFGWTEPLWVRLAFVAIVLCTQLVITPLYLLLWLIVPQARSAEDFILMRGGEVTPDTLNEELIRQSNATNSSVDVVQTVEHSGCLRILLGIFLAVLLFPFIILIIFFVGSIFLMGGISTGFLSGFISHFLSNAFPPFFPTFVSDNNFTLWICIICGLVVALLPIYGIIRALRKSQKRMSTGGIVAGIAIWLAALVIFLLAGFFNAANFHEADWNYTHHRQYNVYYYDDEEEPELELSADSLLIDSIPE